MLLEKVYTGREQLFTSITDVTKENVVEVIKKAMETHETNSSDIKYLFNYWKGKQPILDRVKEIRPEINNKIVENHAQEIVAFKTGYVFGSPIQLVQRGKSDLNNPDGKDDTRISTLNEMLFEEDKASKDTELGETMAICGTAYRIILPKKNIDGTSPFDVLNLNPRTTFVVYSNDIYRKPVMGVSYVEDTATGKREYGVYTETSYFNFKSDEDEVKEETHVLGMIPIIEYPNNSARLGNFEIVLPLLDALNVTSSDRVNDVAQFIQSLIWFNNCAIDKKQFEELRESGGLQTKSEPGNPADVRILTSSLDQTSTQALKDDLYQTMLQIAGVPDRHSSTGGNTGQAILLASGWQTAETHAKATELIFSRSDKRALRIILKIINDSDVLDSTMKDLKISEIDIKFSRNKTDNLLVKTQGLLSQLQAGIHPREAIANVNLYSDPEQVWQNSKEFLEKWKIQTQTVANNNPTQV